MILLSEHNTPYQLLDAKTQPGQFYCVFDFADRDDVDYKFLPALLTYENQATNFILSIEFYNNIYKISVPSDWYILVGDKEVTDLEFIQVSILVSEDFNVVMMNPLNSYKPFYSKVNVDNIFSLKSWNVPVNDYLHVNQALLYPITDKPIKRALVHDRSKDLFDLPCVFLAPKIKKNLQPLCISMLTI